MEKPKIDYKKQGRKNRESGQRFERRVRADLESKNWIVDRWSNNVEFSHLCKLPTRLIPAKHKFRGVGIPMAIGTGFPDFICFRKHELEDVCKSQPFWHRDLTPRMFQIIGVECKSNGYLTKEEKEKCKWYLENNIFSKILIASRGKKRGEIFYKEFKREVKGNGFKKYKKDNEK